MSNHCGNTVNIPCYRVKWFTASNKWRRISDFPNYFNSWNYLSSIGSGITLICWFYFTLSIIGITSILPDPSISGNRWLQGFQELLPAANPLNGRDAPNAFQRLMP